MATRGPQTGNIVAGRPPVLNIGRLAPGGEGYYLDTVASGVEDYYTGDGEAPGYWLTEASAELDLAGRVDAEALRRTLGARHPKTDEELPRTTRRRIPGFDLAFRAPKSVSLVWALGDEATAAVVRDAHDQAVAAAIGYLERHAAGSRRGRARERIGVSGLIAAAFRHRVSRAGDPLLHTHVLVSNLGLCSDGQWRTLDSPRLYSHAKTAGYLYQAALREQLSRRLGVAWTDVRNGTAEIDGVPRDVIKAFSRRRAQILAAMAERGVHSARGAQAATLETRQAKAEQPCTLRAQWRDQALAVGFTPQHVRDLLGVATWQPPDTAAATHELAGRRGLTARASTFTRRDVIQAWCERLQSGAGVDEVERLADAILDNESGLTVQLLAPGAASADPDVAVAVSEVAARTGDSIAAEELRRSDVFATSVAALLAAGWTIKQLVSHLFARELDSAEQIDAVLVWRAQRLARAHGLQAPGGDASTVIRRSDGRVVRADGGEARYSTPELLALEQRLLTQAVARQDAGVAVASTDQVETALRRRPSISDEQAAMVRRLLTSGAGVEVVVGKAGAGKTFALDAARDAWHSAGVSVVGAALAARAAAELNAGSGIDSYTIDALLADLDRGPAGTGLVKNSVIVIDEAAMVGTRKLARLLDHAARANAKVVLVGDHRQLPEIDAGGVFRGLLHRLDPIRLEDNRRQRQEWERAALDELRSGEPAAAISAYAEAGGLTIGETADEVREQLVEDWWGAYRDEGAAAGVMIAARVSDVDDLNDRARRRLGEAGLLDGPALHAAEREYREGDRVVALHNDRRLCVLNGTRATVKAVDVDSRSVRVTTDAGADVELPAEYLDSGHLAHAYAVTGHKAQGLTTERAWVLGSDEIYREWGYVALSRGRANNRLYIVGGDRAADDAHCHGPTDQRSDVVAQLANALQRSRGQALALDHAEPCTSTAETPQAVDHDRLRAVLAAAPRDPQRERQWLSEERDAAHDQLNAAQTRHDAASERLHGLESRLRRLRRRDDIAAAQAELQRAVSDVQRWHERLRDIDRRSRALDDAHVDRAQWLEEHAGDIVTAKRAVDEDRQRAWRAVQAAEFRPPPHVLAAIGPRPADPTERRAWRAAVEQVEQYRLRHGVSDPAVALGDRPQEQPQLGEFERASVAIRAVALAQEQVATHLERPRPPAEQELA